MTIRLGIVGVGKIARDQHLPAIAADPAFDLVAAANRSGPVDGVRTFPDLDAMIAAVPDLDAVSICTPPLGRHALVRTALAHGLHVMLEKPPGATLGELGDLPDLAKANNVALFASWHSREAPAIEPARAWLADKRIANVRIDWKEDVRRWHPDQAWIWEPGGLGVFDPGINALSAVTAMLPHPPYVTSADLQFPANRATPITVDLVLTDAIGTPIGATFDWLQTGEQIWEIAIDTDGGSLLLTGGGTRLDLDGRRAVDRPMAEYPGLYRRFAALVAARQVDFDLSPMRLVEDAFTLGRRIEVAAFADQ